VIMGSGLDSKHNTFLKTFMMNDDRGVCIDTSPDPFLFLPLLLR
jgi:hypothetical protein